jgi:hypothetical protein
MLCRRNSPPLWSSGQSSRLQVKRFGFVSRRYHIFWQVVGLERGPLSLVSIIEELLRRNSGSGLESRDYVHGDSLRWPRSILYQLKLVLTSLTSDGRSVGIVRSRTHSMEFNMVKFVFHEISEFPFDFHGKLGFAWPTRQKLLCRNRYIVVQMQYIISNKNWYRYGHGITWLVEALCHKLEGRRFVYRGQWNVQFS